MRTFVESLRRLFDAGRVTRKKVEGLFYAGSITEPERDYIFGG